MPVIRDPKRTAWEDERPGWLPPLTNPDDAYLRPAPTVGSESLILTEEPITAIRTPNAEPGPSEFTWGRGLMPPTTLADPSQIEVHQAIMRTNPADISSEAGFADRIRESGAS